MPHANAETSDFEKLQMAFQEITVKFGSVDDLLEAFGLADMPKAQRYGVLMGCVVFFCTVCTVLILLILGGSFKRIAEQTQGDATIESDYQARQGRPLLLERLLDARERLLAENYPNREQRENRRTNLTKMLLNLPPPKDIPGVVDDTGAKQSVNKKQDRAEEMEGFKENFVWAYRKCQDKPGGAVIPGKPEAHYEAFARAYAGCGDHTRLSYRRSYARLYETVCCSSDKEEAKFSALYEKRPEALVGQSVRLEALDSRLHLKSIFAATSGDMYFYKKSYDANEVWGFLEEGPFETQDQLLNSFVFQHYENQAAFAIVQNLSDRILGVAMLSKDDPKNLSVQLDAPIVGPSTVGGKEQLEACFLLMDRLFANGYRRVQFSLDSKDGNGSKLADRLGFTFEGVLLKDMVIKNSSRDSKVYAMLNSDWDKGARVAIYRKLYGSSMARVDVNFNKQEEELTEQQRVLQKKETEEAMLKDKNA
eukprot:scaffold2149_cov187-Cylindrotheca_fusiformis.AAC.10